MTSWTNIKFSSRPTPPLLALAEEAGDVSPPASIASSIPTQRETGGRPQVTLCTHETVIKCSAYWCSPHHTCNPFPCTGRASCLTGISTHLSPGTRLAFLAFWYRGLDHDRHTPAPRRPSPIQVSFLSTSSSFRRRKSDPQKKETYNFDSNHQDAAATCVQRNA